MSDLDRIKKHITKDIPITIKNSDGVEDVFYFKPLNMGENILAKEVLSGLLKIQKLTKGKEKDEDLSEDEAKILTDLDTDITKKTFDLFIEIVKRNFDGIDDTTAENFVQTNLDILFGELPNLMPKNKIKKDVDSMNKAKERIESGQNKQKQEATE